MIHNETVTVPVRWVAWCPFVGSQSQNVLLEMKGGPRSHPDKVLVYKAADYLGDDATKVSPGSLHFVCNIGAKKVRKHSYPKQ